MTTFTYLEPLTEGHCTFWAQMVLEAAARDARVGRLRLVTGPQIAERIGDRVAGLGGEVVVIEPDTLARMTQGRLLARGWAQWQAARREARKGPVFLPFFDHAVVAAALDPRPIPGGGRISGVIFRPPNRHGLADTWQSRIDSLRRWTTYSLARRTLGGPLLTLDEVAPASSAGRATGALRYLPDPAPDLSLLASASPVLRDDGRRVVLVFGALTERKGIFQALAAWEMLDPAFHAGHALRFVGRLGADERDRFLRARDGCRKRRPDMRIELEDRFVSDLDLAREVLSAAVILAPYQNHVGSSGVLHWAVAAVRPLITQNTGLIGYQVERYGLGRATDCTDPARIATALLDCDSGASAISGAFLKEHSPGAAIEAVLRTALDD